MALIDELHINDEGTIFLVTIKDKTTGAVVDVSTASVARTIYFIKPSGEQVEKSLDFNTDGVDGQLKYIIENGVLDEVGKWKYQVKLQFDANRIYHTDFKEFYVLSNIYTPAP